MGRLLIALALSAGISVPSASASELIDRDATNVRLAVDAHGRALVTYRAGGSARSVLASGAINARHPHPAIPQVKFRLDYRGGSVKNVCGAYDGPKLAWFVTACRAPDGSYWALQRWQRLLPDFGGRAGGRGAWELRLSHWSGPLASLVVKLDWSYRRYEHLYGTYSYLGHPVFGFRATLTGSPLDTYGRNLYLETYDSAYGRGWRREAGFLAHTGSGKFCWGFFPRAGRPAANGERYRITVIGPGVTPDVYWEGASPGPYNADLDRIANAEQLQLAGDSKYCRPN